MSTAAPSHARADQALTALARANRIRSDRAAFRRRLVEIGTLRALRMAAATASHPPDWALSWQVYGLLAAVPGIGPTKAYQVMKRCLIPQAREVGALTMRQRHDLCSWFEDRARTIEARTAA